MFDSPDREARIVGLHGGGNESDDGIRVGVFVQASFITEAIMRLYRERTGSHLESRHCLRGQAKSP